ncbi:MAG: membrane protein insertase YidC [Polyangiaceae bacterium]|nr:membrane protein insertase YidC [Polyangiaceae bacterium]
MEKRGGALRMVLLGLSALLLVMYVPKLFGGGGGGSTGRQPLQSELTDEPTTRKPEQLCDLWGPRFHAQLGTQGASIKHFYLTSPKYLKAGKPYDLSTTPDQELRRQLRFHWRNIAVAPADDPKWQVTFDTLDWEIRSSTATRCELGYKDARVELTKVVSTTDRPYELAASATVTNRADRPLRHALSVETTDWRRQKDITGGMFRVSPFVTRVECILKDGAATRLATSDFEPDDFKEPAFARNQLNPGDWHQVKGRPRVAAVSNSYFANALVPVASPRTDPVCQLQIEQRWRATRFDSVDQDPEGGAMYRAALAYPPLELGPGQSAQYKVLSYVGPKERDVLAAAGGGRTELDRLIDLGFFSVIAKVLVAFLLQVYRAIPNWGIAIIILTLTARTLLFPLSIPSIKSMIKMRELKPELDALNAKYKDDAQARGLAQMELWRKHKVNPFIGCLPQLATMPVWIALYTTLQTAVELYNIPFLWFPDLSQPDRFYILPFIIGGTSFVQQKMMPMQGGDPTQQKMMLYLMPGMFTVFMLFLPAGLGVYMFTNGVLGIVQQQAVEWHARRSAQRAGRGSGPMLPEAAPAPKSGAPATKAAPRATASSQKGSSKPRRERRGSDAKFSEG